MSNKAVVTFNDPETKQSTVVFFMMDGEDLEFKVRFDPPVETETDLGLAGQLAQMFCKQLSAEE